MTRIYLLGLVFVFLAACSSSPTTTSHSSLALTALKHARAQIGVKYRYGGTNPATGFDCSGLVYYSYSRAGKRLPRSTKGLYKVSRSVEPSELRPGDLVFFKINRRKVSHVGIYLGNSRFVHAPSTGKHVEVTSLENRYWRKRFSRGGRI